MKPFYLALLTFILLHLSLSATGTTVDSIATPKLWLEEQNNIGQQLLKDNQFFDQAVTVFKSASDFAATQNLSDQFPELLIGYGIALYKNGDIQNAHSILIEILPKIKSSNLKLQAEVYQIIGMTLVFKNKFPEGYKYQMDALQYYSEIKDSAGVMSVHFDLGSNFVSQGQSKLALNHYEKGIVLAEAINDTKMIILGNTAIGGTWASLKDFDKALKYIDESIRLAKVIGDNEELAWASINRGHILGQQGKYEEAEPYLQKAYDLSFVIGNKLLTAYSLEQMSDLCLQQGKVNKAIEKLDESYEFYEELGQSNSLQNLTKKYAEIYFQQENFKKYKEYTDQYILLKDSLYSKDMMESMASLKQDFEIQKLERENQIKLLTKDQEFAKAKSYTISAITCGTIVVFVLLLVMMYNRNQAATEKNEILTAKNAEILRQNESLINSNNDLEKFAYIISHDLKEPLRNINGFTRLLKRKLTKYTMDEDINEYAQFITNGTEQMSDLLNGLLEYSKVSVNKAEKEVINFNELVQKVLNNFTIQLEQKNCTVQVAPLPNIACRSIQLNQVFQNLIANAIKFGPAKGNKINISVQDTGEDYRFCIQDNGIGIEPEYQKDIFVVFKRLNDRGTYSGSGIGLATCKKIVEDHGGTIDVKSEKGKGSCFFFTLPKTPTSEIFLPKEVSSSTNTPVVELVG